MADQSTFSPNDAASRARMVLLRLVRMSFLVVIATVTLLYTLERRPGIRAGESQLEVVLGWWLPVGVAVAGVTLVLLIDALTPRKKISTISGVVFGLIVGLTFNFGLSAIIDLVAATYGFKDWSVLPGVKVLLGICLCYLGVAVVLQTQDDFRLVIPYVEFAKQIRGTKPLLLDTSALIDARIADLAATGMLQSPLVIPGFVVNELQTLADSSEKLKRARGRRGLDIVARLRRSGLDVSIDDSPVPGKGVDQMLVELARAMPGIVVTADAALARIADIQGVPVLNINEVANALKPALVPGSTLPINLLRAGEQPGQAIGFLDDGTMVVVDRAQPLIGTTARVEVTSSLQTAAGRLIFARLTETPILAEDAALIEAAGATAESIEPPESAAGAPAEQAPPEVPSDSTESPLGGPVRVSPPPPPEPARPGPIAPFKGQRNPLRNPRR